VAVQLLTGQTPRQTGGRVRGRYVDHSGAQQVVVFDW
jgi:hypothetical protein